MLSFLMTGNFPWMVPPLRYFVTHSERGEQFALLEEAALSIVKARRESKRPGKVCCHYYVQP